MSELTPPDTEQCQATPNLLDYSFMSMGPCPKPVRCENRPVVIAREKAPGRDGQCGRMSLCESCKELMVQHLDPDKYEFEPIPEPARDPELGMLQTAVAVAEVYYGDNRDQAMRMAPYLGPAYDGFPGIWLELARFARDLDRTLAKDWDSGSREFVEDVDVLTRAWMDLAESEGRFPDLETALDLVKSRS